MNTESAVVQLGEADAVTLVHLLEAFGTLLDAVELDDSLRADLMGAAIVDRPDHDRWQQRLAAEVAAASGMLRQLLDGYDPRTTIAEASPAGGSPGVDHGPR